MTQPPAALDTRARFVETMGLIAEAEGMARIMGRIFGFLLLAETPHSLDDLATALGVSKASVSTDARRLEMLGLLERVGMPGDRRDFYQLAPRFVERAIRAHLERMATMRAALQDVRADLEANDVVLQRLAQFEQMFDHGICTLERDLAAFERGEFSRPPEAS